MSSVHETAALRGTGRTKAQLAALPKGSVFVWVGHDLRYPRNLAQTMGRDDIVVVSTSWITDQRWQGLTLTGLAIDHAVSDYRSPGPAFWHMVQQARARVRKAG